MLDQSLRLHYCIYDRIMNVYVILLVFLFISIQAELCVMYYTVFISQPPSMCYRYIELRWNEAVS